MASGSKKAIFASMAGNGLIAITKFAAAGYTGSSAMLSEAIHSVVDTGNQVLILYGMHRSKQKADATHPFGYGRELYFWSFVVAILIFALGAGVSIYEGVDKILRPHEVSNPFINYIVLALAFVFEGAASWIAVKEFNAVRNGRSWIRAIRDSKDPGLFIILFENAAAMIGLVVAFVGIYAAQYLNLPMLDGVASVGVGIVLAVTAVLLAYETKALLIGEAAAEYLVEGVEDIVAGEDAVCHINELRTMHMGPDDVLLALSLDFKDGIAVGRVEDSIYKLENNIKNRFPEVKRIFIEVQAAEHHEEMLETDKERAQKS
ncbi:MAG: cation transporter [Rhizobiales bacterium]|nr:cation transporter [Hyphomicrobiales bacterium]